MTTRPVAIIGAGLAGLACALHLHQRGIPVRVFEASDGVGGRVRTDERDGFLLDRGFQVLQTSYPEAQRMLDYDALQLGSFSAGALVPVDGDLHLLCDPFRSPTKALASLRAPVGTLADKLRVARLRLRVGRGQASRLLQRAETTTAERLENAGFTNEFVERFLQPWFAGVFLESQLATSSRWFELLFRMFSTGDAALPAGGMQQIPEQLAAQLPEATIHLGTRVREVNERSITLEDGETVLCGAAVVATSELAAAALLDQPLAADREPRSVHWLAFDAPSVPFSGPHLMLGKPDGVINNLCVPNSVAPSYAPPGRHLVSVTVLQEAAQEANELEAVCRTELHTWFGAQVAQWRLLDHQLIDDALPPQEPGQLLTELPLQLSPGIFRCGDYLETSSIHGALVSGRKTAAAVRIHLANL